MDASPLHELLGARERRYRLRCARAAEPSAAAIAEIAVVIPGLPKRTPALEAIFDRAVALLAALTGAAPRDRLEDEAGDYALFVLSGRSDARADARADETEEVARALKRAACRIEEAAPWGRLLDIDCHVAGGRKLGREAIGLAPRRCLLCDAPHDACIAARRHPLAEARAAALALAATIDLEPAP
jgi:holo-ACP synthase